MVCRSKARGLLRPATSCLRTTADIVIILSLAYAVGSQTPPNHKTDPNDAHALNTVFQKWGIKAPNGKWNNNGQLCSGVAIDDTSFTDPSVNPMIKCDCQFDDGSTCRINKLSVYSAGVTGPIPDELWSLTYLDDLNLARNVLTGSISPSIGNLTRMKYLTLGENALTGQIPKEFGMLSKMITLSFGVNNFSGELPSELGNLTNLQELWIPSCGVNGPLPSTFKNLQKLNTLMASDNNHTGPIPEFIGNWPDLKKLLLFGNSFDGPIPSSFSNLVSMSDLRISDVRGVNSTLSFIQNMKNLTVLILRNNNITDSIPPTIGEYSSLGQLDLSFNNIYGEIPNSLFNMGSLSFLFLGHNSLKGNLPLQKSSALLNIDLSYNFLSGSIPSWVRSKNLNLNLVGNNFTNLKARNRGLPFGLNCLQKNFPCFRGKPTYSSFAINCGGPEIRSSGLVYEGDNSILGPADYYVSDTRRWAVSNVGFFTDNENSSYISTSTSQFKNTSNSELYQTSRISASSLRYYGLGLENGNYTVSLYFAESVFTDSNWTSLGRRIFDIYIQGNIVAKDFDIRNETGGLSLIATVKNFTASVTENYLEIHLFWAGKGTHPIPVQATYGPTISAISTTPNFIPTVSNKPPASNKNHTGVIVGAVVGVAVVGFLAAFLIYFLVQRKRLRGASNGDDLLGIDSKPYIFSYAELKAATNEFSPANKLGEGGFGPVFKGTLKDGRVIAVKQLSLTSNQGKNQFIAEIEIISAVQHRNLVKLYGCCIEVDKRLLVYEYLKNKSLDQAIFGKGSLNLDWSTRYDICLGIAKGLAYLHEESRLRIVHRDVKASNILLDSDLTPKISDFGLAKLYNIEQTHITTGVAGTVGYLAPEYAIRGHLTEKTDVFAFGVVALEVLSGRPNSDLSLKKDEVYLLEWAWNLREQNREAELVDARLSDFNKNAAKRVVHIALQCTQTSPAARPAMSRVVAMLLGDIEVSAVTTKPTYLTDWKHTEDDSATSLSIEAERNNGPTQNNSKGYISPEIATPSRTIMKKISEGR